MVAVYLPPAWLALVPIIFIESAYGTWQYKFPFGRSFAAQSIANCFSTLIGIPITWLVLVLVEIVTVEWGGRVIPKSLLSILSPVLGAAWLSPLPDEEWWPVALAVVILTIVFYLMFVATEGFVVVRFFPDVPRKTIRSWVVRANAMSYALLLMLISGALLMPKVSGPAVQFMQPVSEAMVDVVFLVVDQVAGTRQKEPPLIQAVEAGDLRKAEQPINKGADANQTDSVGFPALSDAAASAAMKR